jgi:mRNA interferase MazF
MFQPGEIVQAAFLQAAFPFSDLTASKRRPCLILACCDSPDDFIVAFITSSATAPSGRHSIGVPFTHPEWRKTGLKVPSIIRADKIPTLHTSVISGAIGILPEDLMTLVQQTLQKLLWPIPKPRT